MLYDNKKKRAFVLYNSLVLTIDDWNNIQRMLFKKPFSQVLVLQMVASVAFSVKKVQELASLSNLVGYGRMKTSPMMR